MKGQISIEILFSLVLVMLFAAYSIALIASANSSASGALAGLRTYAASAVTMANDTAHLCGCILIGQGAVP